jgi:hypothetical protein
MNEHFNKNKHFDPSKYYSYKKIEPQKTNYPVSENVLDEAKRLIEGDRAEAYGSPLNQYEKLAELWSVMLDTKITAEQAVMLLIGMKLLRAYDQTPRTSEGVLTREEKTKHRDSIVDIAGYSGVLGKIEQEKGWW